MRPSPQPPKPPSGVFDSVHRQLDNALAAWGPLLFILLALTAPAQSQTFTTLYNFTDGSDGGSPSAGVVEDKAGNLYGTTVEGGGSGCNGGCGVVFKVTSAGTETVLHTFSDEPDGAYPEAAVILDGEGNVYGTTWMGGSSDYGAVFKIDTAGNETILYSFAGGTSDGCYPWQGLVMDKAGNLYGTTLDCGASGYGTVFEVTSAGKESILHSFAGGRSDGAYPSEGHLIMDKPGDFYGLTATGGGSSNCSGVDNGCGVLYKLTKKRKLTMLHSFQGGARDGCLPHGTPAVDTKGNFYGTANACGDYSYGTVWKVSKQGKETILHSFAEGTSDGCYPVGGVALDSKGNLYGNTPGCGANYYGTVWELSKKTLTLLHSFARTDGYSPQGDVFRNAKGDLYGTTAFGGSGSPDGGTVWAYVP